MEDLSIKIKIADREYPMKVKSSDEEKVRAAGKMINEKLKHYRSQFGIEDKQDLLAMVAFDSFVDHINGLETDESVDQSIIEKVNHLNQLLAQV